MEKLLSLIPVSWRTTIIGIVGGLAVIFGELNNLLDGNESTSFDWQKFAAGLAVIGIGWFARDKNVTSEQEAGK